MGFLNIRVLSPLLKIANEEAVKKILHSSEENFKRKKIKSSIVFQSCHNCFQVCKSHVNLCL